MAGPVRACSSLAELVDLEPGAAVGDRFTVPEAPRLVYVITTPGGAGQWGERGRWVTHTSNVGAGV